MKIKYSEAMEKPEEKIALKIINEYFPKMNDGEKRLLKQCLIHAYLYGKIAVRNETIKKLKKQLINNQKTSKWKQ